MANMSAFEQFQDPFDAGRFRVRWRLPGDRIGSVLGSTGRCLPPGVDQDAAVAVDRAAQETPGCYRAFYGYYWMSDRMAQVAVAAADAVFFEGESESAWDQIKKAQAYLFVSDLSQRAYAEYGQKVAPLIDRMIEEEAKR